MGKNIMIYFDDEAIDLVEKIEGRGTLINQLVKDHFSNDIEFLERKLKTLDLEKSITLKKLDVMKNQKIEIQQRQIEKSRCTNKLIENREKREIEARTTYLKNLYDKFEIKPKTEKEFWAFSKKIGIESDGSLYDFRILRELLKQ